MRQIVLDTETTGLETSQGHRVIEIGAVELIDRRPTGNHFHYYLNPQRDIEDGALEVHGITREFLEDKPLFSEVADEFIRFVRGAELIIHNAEFDLGFLNSELSLLDDYSGAMADFTTVLDTLELARDLHPGQRNNLDALCRRYEIDNSSRKLHGALLDAEILADVYLAMTGGQTDLGLSFNASGPQTPLHELIDSNDRPPFRILKPNTEELALHEARLAKINETAGQCLWLDLESEIVR